MKSDDIPPIDEVDKQYNDHISDLRQEILRLRRPEYDEFSKDEMDLMEICFLGIPIECFVRSSVPVQFAETLAYVREKRRSRKR